MKKVEYRLTKRTVERKARADKSYHYRNYHYETGESFDDQDPWIIEIFDTEKEARQYATDRGFDTDDKNGAYYMPNCVPYYLIKEYWIDVVTVEYDEDGDPRDETWDDYICLSPPWEVPFREDDE